MQTLVRSIRELLPAVKKTRLLARRFLPLMPVVRTLTTLCAACGSDTLAILWQMQLTKLS